MSLSETMKDWIYQKNERIDESVIYDLNLTKAMADIARTMYPDTVRVTFSKNHPVILTNYGWKVGKNVDRRGLVNKFESNELTEDEIRDILQDCIDSPMLNTRNTPQFDWDAYFDKYVKNTENLTREEWIARWGINADLPTVSRDPADAAKRKRLRAIQRVKEYRNATEGKNDMIPFSIDTVRSMLKKVGALRIVNDWDFPGTPYIVPNKGLIRFRKMAKDGTQSNSLYKIAKVEVFRDPKRPSGRYSDTPRRWEDISGYLCSRADLKAACEKINEMDWENIKEA